MNEPRILLVDDDMTLLQALPHMIALRMYRITVDTGASAHLLAPMYTRAGGKVAAPQEGDTLKDTNTILSSGDYQCLGVRLC